MTKTKKKKGKTAKVEGDEKPLTVEYNQKLVLNRLFLIAMTLCQFGILLTEFLAYLNYFMMSGTVWFALYDCCCSEIYEANNFMFPPPKMPPIRPSKNVDVMKKRKLNASTGILIVTHFVTLTLCGILVVTVSKYAMKLPQRFVIGLGLSIFQNILLMIVLWLAIITYDLSNPTISMGFCVYFLIAAFVLSYFVLFIMYLVPDILVY